MWEIRKSGSEGGAAQTNASFLPLSVLGANPTDSLRLRASIVPVVVAADVRRLQFQCVRGAILFGLQSRGPLEFTL